MDIRGLLENTYYHLQKAEESYGAGDNLSAYKEYSESARCLLQAAKLSDGELKRVRLENAEKLLGIARKIKARHPFVAGKKEGGQIENMDAFEDLGVTVANIPDVTFGDVAGLDEVKDEILNKVIYPMKNMALAKEYSIRPGGGVLLFGPPGTGKTFVAKAISHEVNAKFVYVNPSSLTSKWFGSFEKKIEKLFRLARENAPTVIFFDEIDALAPKRSKTDSSVMKRAVPQLLAEMDGFSKNLDQMVLVIGATNNPWDIDEAILRPGRFDSKIYIGPPDKNARRMLFELSLKDRKKSGGINYDRLADLTEGYSGADIDYICRKASENAFRLAIEDGVAREIAQADIEDVISKSQKSIDSSSLEKYRHFSVSADAN